MTQEQKDTFWRDGVLVSENAVNSEELTSLRAVFSTWVEERRENDNDYGETLDGRPRFDLQPGNSADTPGLRQADPKPSVQYDEP